MGSLIDLTGRRFGRLIVVSRAENSKSSRLRWNCICDCGAKITAIGCNLRSGRTKSCGCLQKDKNREAHLTHGMKGTRAYNVWTNMRQRCLNKNNDGYMNYGGRGIRVCERWDKFDNFYADMGERPDGMSIERKDNNGNYCPENCCWENRKTQNRNTRSNRIIKYQGREQCMAAWAEELGVKYITLVQRLKTHPPQIAFNM